MGGQATHQKRSHRAMSAPAAAPAAPSASVARHLLPAHARKPGVATGAPPAKRAKLASASVARPAQQLRISDLLAADRRRRAVTPRAPAIVAGATHMDLRRPLPRVVPAARRQVDGEKVAEADVLDASVGKDTGKPEDHHPPISSSRNEARNRSAKKPPLPPVDKEAVLETQPALTRTLKKPSDRKRRVVPQRLVVSTRPSPLAANNVPVSSPSHSSSPSPSQTRSPSLSRSPSPRVVDSSSSSKIAAPGAEALRFDRSQLPEKHNTLLDMLSGLEQAMGLLATRHSPPEFAAVRKIVASATKRTFTLRHLSQLATLIPEALAVLPPKVSTVGKTQSASSRAAAASLAAVAARRNDRLVIRLDCVSDLVNGSARTAAAPALAQRVGRLGDVAARSRRRLLHTRLLEHTEQWHANFLRRNKISDFAGILWHRKFNVDRHVADLPAPPLYPEAPPTVGASTTDTDQSRSTGKTPNTNTASSAVDDLMASPLKHSQVVDSIASSPATGQKREAGEETTASRIDSLPESLVARVRARQAAKAVRDAGADAAAHRLLMQRLPATLDAVRSILAVGRRNAMGWTALVAATAAMHPDKWSKSEVEEQLDGIAQVAGAWCEKKALSGPRGGYSFRITNEQNFARARKAVVACRVVEK